jgi:hypothetical protein
MQVITTTGVTITLAHGLAGWALCRATMGISMSRWPLAQALVIHAIAAPLIFALFFCVVAEKRHNGIE